MIFKAIKFNRLWELQCKQCTYAKTAEGPHLLLLFPSSMMPSRAGQFSRALQSWSSKPSACVAAQLLLYLWVRSVADDSWHRNRWWLGQTCHVCCSPIPVCMCAPDVGQTEMGRFLGGLTLPWQNRPANQENWVPEVMNCPTGQKWPESTIYPTGK